MQINVTEQSSYDFIFVQPRLNSNVVLTNMNVNKFATLFDGFNQIYSSTAGATCQFRFRGRRVGILLTKNSTYGVLAFDVDGTDYGTYDCSQIASGQTIDNLPYIIATDLPDGEHVLTVTKLDTNSISIQGFMVENSGNVQTFMRTGYNYHDMLDGNLSSPKAIGTTDTTVDSIDIWVHNFTFTNTTASPINITLKSITNGVVVGPFPIPANDVRQLSGPMFFSGGLKVVGSATGVTMTIGGQ